MPINNYKRTLGSAINNQPIRIEGYDDYFSI
jgi:hypothetical protein